jgi:hypothetical protein
MDARDPAGNEEQLERGKMPDTNSGAEGSIGHTSDVLKKYKHPFILAHGHSK